MDENYIPNYKQKTETSNFHRPGPMTETTSFPAISILSDRIKGIEDRTVSLSNELSNKSSRRDCARDHDSVIQHDARIKSLEEELANMFDDCSTCKSSINEFQLNQNIFAEKIARITESNANKKTAISNIWQGIIITVVGAIILGLLSTWQNSLIKQSNDEFKKTIIDMVKDEGKK